MNRKRQILLLNCTEEVLSFISENKALKLLFKGKAELIYTWNNKDNIKFGNIIIGYPATLKMKYYVRRNVIEMRYSKALVFRRDCYTCQYCAKVLKSWQITVEHIIPKFLGGQSTFLNCVSACFKCNFKKGNKTTEQANMFPISKPYVPTELLFYYPSDTDIWHESWHNFLNLRKKNS